MGILDFFRGFANVRVARRYMQALRDSGETRKLVHVPAEHVIEVLDERGDRVKVLFLGNLARDLKNSPEEAHADIYRKYAAGSATRESGMPDPTYGSISPTLRILLKDETYPAYIALQHKIDFPSANPSSFVFESVAADVIACCVEESANGLRFVTAADLAKWGVGAQQVLEDAKRNISALPWEIKSADALDFVFSGDSFHSARLVNRAIFECRTARGGVVAMVPNRNTLLLADAADLESLRGLAFTSGKLAEEADRLVSGTPLVFGHGAWHAFAPPEADKISFQNTARMFAARQWKDYKNVQERVFERDAVDVLVASLKLMQDEKTNSFWTRVVWSQGIDTVLPVADQVVFYVDDAQPLRSAQWDVVVRVMKASMQVLEGPPTRFRVNDFPTSAQFLAMGAQEL